MEERKPRKLTPMSGELKAQADWVSTAEIPEQRPAREEKSPPVTRRQILIAGLRRSAIILVILFTLVAALALLLMRFGDMDASRAFPLAFFVGGAFITLGGFLAATTGPSYDWMPERGVDQERRQIGINNSLVYGSFGIVLIVVGVVLDTLL
jgi:uncharacterized membrane protein YidH (DUF202 family)